MKKEEYVPTPVRLLQSQYQRLRKESFDTGVSQAEIVREALEMRWAQEEKREEKKMKRAEQTGCQVAIHGNFLPYLVEEGRNSYLDDSSPVNVIGEAKLLDIDEDRAVFEIEGEVTVQWLDGLRQVEYEEVFRF